MTATTNKEAPEAYIKIDLPYVHTRDFQVFQEAVRNEALPSEWDWQYAVVNMITDVIEARAPTLAYAVVMMQYSQSMLDKVINGEINGFGNLTAAPV